MLYENKTWCHSVIKTQYDLSMLNIVKTIHERILPAHFEEGTYQTKSYTSKVDIRI